MEDLQAIGFYTLSDARAKTASESSDLQRCELILTHRCNFHCPYCRGMLPEDQQDIKKEEAFGVIDLWAEHNLHNIRFSGGEPTLWPWLIELVAYSKFKGIDRIALSTNGSAAVEYYIDLFRAGVTDFSISLDSCCSATGNKMAGINAWKTVTTNIKRLSEVTYVTVGIVLTEDNYIECNEIIAFASSLGVSDIRIIPAAQISKRLEGLKIDSHLLDKYPILKYRFANFSSGRGVRGLTKSDNHQCPLVLDDMAVLNGKHYPCIIYMRERGRSIGRMVGGIADIRKRRKEWFESHDCFADPICNNNCLDVCVDYNNRVKKYNNWGNDGEH